jgi:GxxExxY protein
MPLLYESLTAKILEAAFEVSSELGAGFVESVYQNALFIVLQEKGLHVAREMPLQVKFHEEIVGSFFADLMVNNTVLIELKSVSTLLPEHKAQVINYLKASGLEVGLLINFGRAKIEYHRLEHPNLRRKIPKLNQDT